MHILYLSISIYKYNYIILLITCIYIEIPLQEKQQIYFDISTDLCVSMVSSPQRLQLRLAAC